MQFVIYILIWQSFYSRNVYKAFMLRHFWKLRELHFLRKFIFDRKWAKWAQNCPKIKVFWMLWKVFWWLSFWICAQWKVLLISVLPAQILGLWKFWFLNYKSKCHQPMRLQDSCISYIWRKKHHWTLFLAWWYRF